MQKIAYFCRYADWNIKDYRLHHYGPFSIALTGMAETAESMKFVSHTGDPNVFTLTSAGKDMLETFEREVCDSSKTNHMKKIVAELSDWKVKDLELVSTIDFVKNCDSELGRDALVGKVHTIKGHFKRSDVATACGKWVSLKKSLGLK